MTTYTPAQARDIADMFPKDTLEGDALRALADQVEALEAQLAAVGQRPTKYWAYVKDGVSDVFDMPPLPAGTRFTAIPVKDEFGNKFALIDLTNSAPPQYWIYTAQEKISDIQAQVL